MPVKTGTSRAIMRQFKRIIEDLELNSVQANIALSQTTSGTGVEELRSGGRITQKKAAQLTTGIDEDVTRHAPSSPKLQLSQILKKRLQVTQQLAEANEKLVEDAIERENQYLAELEKTFDRVESQKLQKDEELAKESIESKKFIQDLMIQSLERVAEFEKVRFNLRKVLCDTGVAQSQIQLDALKRSHPLRRWIFNPLG
jgi:hypothetical protein